MANYEKLEAKSEDRPIPKRDEFETLHTPPQNPFPYLSEAADAKLNSRKTASGHLRSHRIVLMVAPHVLDYIPGKCQFFTPAEFEQKDPRPDSLSRFPVGLLFVVGVFIHIGVGSFFFSPNRW